MTEIAIYGFAFIGAAVMLIVSIIAFYAGIALGLTLIGRGLRRLNKFVFYRFGGVAKPKTGEYKPPRPPWDRVRYEIGRLRHYNEVALVKIGVLNSVNFSLNGLEKVYKEREEHYD